MIEMLNMDCMEYMAVCADKAFDLAIVDPPYGIGEDGGKRRYGTKSKAKGFLDNTKYQKKDWDNSVPDKSYFEALLRVSKNQIIWGGNYFILPATPCYVVWHKKGADKSDFADCELAWTSFDSAIRMFDFPWVGFGGINSGEKRIHPTQKPVALYKWLLSRYAKPGDRILDTHGGSGSICIACHDLGYDLTWMELDADYYKAAVERYQNHAAQGSLFEPEAIRQPTQGALL